MTNKEKKELKVDEEDSDEKNHPLSREGWIMVLSGEINKEEMKLSTYWNACLVVILAYMGGVVVVLISLSQSGTALDELNFLNFPSVFIPIFLVLIVIVWIIYNRDSRILTQERVKPLKNTREAIISGKLTDFSEIHRKWKEYIKKYYGKLLEKSEMDEEKEKIKEGGEKSGEMVLEKSIKEHKEVLQAPQSDISEIKGSLREIKGILVGSKFFNFWCVFGGVCTATGLAIMGMSFPLWSADPFLLSSYILAFVFGLFIFLAGILLIKGADYAGTDFKKYPDKFDMKLVTELRRTNKWLFRGFLLIVCDIFILIVFYILSFYYIISRISFIP